MLKPTILLIEDNSFQAKATMEILEGAGYRVLWEETGLGGFKTATTNRPDLVLLDVVLPDKDGIEICRYLKMNEMIRDIPIIILTSRGETKDRVKGLNIGADDYLPKPFDRDELLARINAFLRIKRLQDELKSKHEQLEGVLKRVEIMAITDAGTGLYNRRFFMESLDREFSRAKRYNSPLSMVLVDLDHFKKVNDTYGHLVGDSVLESIGNLIKGQFRHIEIPARYGGEEFAILFPETGLAEAEKPARRLIEQIRGFRFKGMPAEKSITVSIGIAALPDSQIESKENLIHCADFALYRAKERGRDRLEISSGSEALKAGLPGHS